MDKQIIAFDDRTTIDVEAIRDAIIRWNSNPDSLVFAESSWQNGVVSSVTITPKRDLPSCDTTQEIAGSKCELSWDMVLKQEVYKTLLESQSNGTYHRHQ